MGFGWRFVSASVGWLATKAVIRDWIDSGGYDRAVAAIVADGPDLQTQ